MSILPNLNKRPSQPPSAQPDKQQAPSQTPETVRLLLQAWAVMVGLELLHQIFNVVMSLMDLSAVRALAREQAASDEMSDAMINAVSTATVFLMGAFNLIIVAVLTWMIFIVKKRSKRVPTAFLLLSIFSFFFILRILMLFFASPGANDVPIAMYAVDGSIQILAGVAAAIAYALSRKEESVKWITA